MNQTIPALPSPLSLYVLHSPAVVRKHEQDTRAHFEAVRAAEQAVIRDAAAAKEFANRALSPDEYHALAIERENERRSASLEREAAEFAEAAEKEKLMASSPTTVQIVERSEMNFILAIQHWAGRGYAVDFAMPWYVQPGFYSIDMNKPATATTKAKGAAA